MGEWQPANVFEERLGEALAVGDLVFCLGLLRHAEFVLPITTAAAAGHEPVVWPIEADDERTWLMVYTSIEAMRAGTGGAFQHGRVASLPELAAAWPDLRWGLAINPGLPVHFFLEPGAVARLAVPSLVQDREVEPESGVAIVQKLLRPRDVHAYLADGEFRVSGYCHHALDVAHIATPTVLADALGQSAEEMVTEEGSVVILRWYAVGPDLYRTPYGGVDEETMTAVAGWVIEEPPFIGMGLVPNVGQLIREYKVDGVELPYGAEIYELTIEGVERRRAMYDGDLGRWRVVHDAPVGVPDGRHGSESS
ncbi:SseB family protein [Streptosporangium sp. CA-135522]|uniref:SseB family protein n=1 Tax=Streptosporangium sp. CA-135522 TaxID=3240072 RepID=UPI003D8A6AD3